MRAPLAILLSATVSTLAMPALAADYDPPIFVEQASPWVNVEIGSGWYLRGDVSYNLDDLLYDLGEDDIELSRLGGSIGFGYHFNDLLRADFNVGYLGGDSYSFDFGGGAAVDASYAMWNAMANVYLDLGTFVGVTPYIGAGAGMTYARQSIDTPIGGLADRQYNFSYALLAGLSYQITNNVSVDLGYQFLDTPGLEYVDLNTLEVVEGHKQHQIRVGLRYDLW